MNMQSRKPTARASQEHPDVAPTKRGARGAEPEPPRWVENPKPYKA
jgi:hypothetical protein